MYEDLEERISSLECEFYCILDTLLNTLGLNSCMTIVLIVEDCSWREKILLDVGNNRTKLAQVMRDSFSSHLQL